MSTDPATDVVHLWQPSPEVADTPLERFTEHVRRTRQIELADYDALWRWSVTELADFWAAVWEFFELDTVSGYDDVLASEAMPGASWFTGSRVNLATYLLGRGAPTDVAIVSVDEDGTSVSLTREELRRQVAAFAGWLREVGVEEGDRVVGYLPNIAEAVVAFLGTASRGAIWSSVGQDYAAPAVVDRFAQLEPKVLVTASGYRFNGKVHERSETVAAVEAGLPTLERTVMVDRPVAPAPAPDATREDWAALVARDAAPHQVAVPFDHPLWVLFSSGTTGLPKGLVHGHGGILVETLKQMALHWDLRADDRVFWYTSPSWVMWNLQLSTLALGGSIVCYDGSPTHPDPSTLWRIVADHDVTFFGTSPGFLQASEKAGLRPANDFDLSSLRAMGSTGSPLPPLSHVWARDAVGALPLWSMSGGTDICGAFAGGARPCRSGRGSSRCAVWG